MKVLIGCEFSGVVRDAFLKLGHNAWSCDLLPCERDAKRHIQADVLDVLTTSRNWDLAIFHPPCTHLARSGARWVKDRPEMQVQALEFVTTLLGADIPRIALENPIGAINSKVRKPDQIIQPWMFGHGETKSTCLWLKGLPKLMATAIADERSNRILMEPDSKDRWKRRARTLEGVGRAMAEQWGG